MTTYSEHALQLNLPNLIATLIFSVIIFLCYRKYYAPRGDKFSTFWPRFWAPTVDELFLWIPTVLLPYVLHTTFFDTPEDADVLYMAAVLVSFAYSISFHWRFGATLGKQVTRVRVVDAKTEGPISFLQAVIRDSIPILLVVGLIGYMLVTFQHEDANVSPMFRFIPWIILSWFFAEVITMLTNEKRRALHDFLAGTVVIRTHLKVPPSESRS